MATKQISFPPLPQLVPHRKPMLLVDSLESASEEAARALAHIGADNIFVTAQGILERAAYMELLAQTFAAGAGAMAGPSQRNRLGFLVGVRSLVIKGDARVGDVLTIDVRITTRLEPLLVVEGRVLRGQQTLAEGQVKIYVGEPGEQA